jgi:DNA-directed RNA polymerase sigma subunit (sigma70/sigma32)
MKTRCKDEMADELRSEYDLATLLKAGERGKYAKRYEQGTNLVLLSPDVARDFANDEAVNEALRLVVQLQKIPRGGKHRAAKDIPGT